MLITRSSFGKLTALAALTAPFTGVGGVNVAGVLPVGFAAVKIVPVPSSLMVPTPVAIPPPVLLATKLNVSPLSDGASLVIATRTNKPPLGICTKLPAV